MNGPGANLRAALVLVLLAGLGAAPAAAKEKARVIENLCETASCARDFSNVGLTMSPSGDIYGVNDQDGDNHEGSVFRLHQRAGHNKWTYQTVYSFCAQTDCTDGSFPRGRLIADMAGNLYGTTATGGPTGHGEIFRLTPGGAFDVLYGFCPANDSCPDGASPGAALTYPNAASAAFYDGVSPLTGVAYGGGSHNGGTAFQLTPGSGGWSFAVLINYNSACAPEAIVMTTGTDVYETQRMGCETVGSGSGAIMLLQQTTKSWKETVLYAFCAQPNCTDGGDPRGPVVIDGSGAIYGAGDYGGNAGGTAYKLTFDGKKWKLQLLHTFCSSPGCHDGEWPMGGLIADANGNLFGTTNGYGNRSRSGTIFEIGEGGLQTLYEICSGTCKEGSRPIAGVVMDGAGNLFGKTTMGGTQGSGTVFELSP
jgi:uncharacterized repeat protein (TIGR03803 family)